MQFTDNELNELIEAVRLDTGTLVTLEEAREIARRGMVLYELLSRPLPNGAKQPSDVPGAPPIL